jgi:hypothetical protein
MKLYTLHTVNDGKWQIKLSIRRDSNYEFQFEPRPDIRVMVETNYDESPEVLAKILLDSVLHCEAVEVHLLCGQGLYIKRVDDDR